MRKLILLAGIFFLCSCGKEKKTPEVAELQKKILELEAENRRLEHKVEYLKKHCVKSKDELIDKMIDDNYELESENYELEEENSYLKEENEQSIKKDDYGI